MPDFGISTFLAFLIAATVIAFLGFAWFRLLRFALALDAKKIFPPASFESASAAADERRRFLSERLGRLGETAERSPPSFEILENPPGQFVSDSRITLSFVESAAQYASLHWQLRDDAFLLLGRVIDLVTLLCRERKELSDSVYQIDLTPAKSGAIGQGSTFPFKVHIYTSRPVEWALLLEPFQDWLSIALSLRVPRRVDPFGNCAVGGGKQGKAGGFFWNQGNLYQITCAHVVSPACQSSVLRSQLSWDTFEPDIAVLRGGNPCFQSLFSGTHVVPIDGRSSHLHARERFFRVPGRNRCGVFETVVGWVKYQGRIHKFPHAQIFLDVSMIGDLFRWPPSWIKFSKKGDSGSWVVGSAGKDWLGVLVAGNRIFGFSYVALAGPVMDYVTIGAKLSSSSQIFEEGV